MSNDKKFDPRELKRLRRLAKGSIFVSAQGEATAAEDREFRELLSKYLASGGQIEGVEDFPDDDCSLCLETTKSLVYQAITPGAPKLTQVVELDFDPDAEEGWPDDPADPFRPSAGGGWWEKGGAVH